MISEVQRISIGKNQHLNKHDLKFNKLRLIDIVAAVIKKAIAPENSIF